MGISSRRESHSLESHKSKHETTNTETSTVSSCSGWGRGVQLRLHKGGDNWTEIRKLSKSQVDKEKRARQLRPREYSEQKPLFRHSDDPQTSQSSSQSTHQCHLAIVSSRRACPDDLATGGTHHQQRENSDKKEKERGLRQE
jgi:hypothetical protein